MSDLKLYGTGRRKRSVARVFLKSGSGKILINGKSYEDYLCRESLAAIVTQPLALLKIENAYDITLESDYTIGKIMELNIYQKHYLGDQTVTFCGFRKPHPHINNSIIRVAFKTEIDIPTVSSYLIESLNEGITFYKKLLTQFGELSDDEKAGLKSIPV